VAGKPCSAKCGSSTALALAQHLVHAIDDFGAEEESPAASTKAAPSCTRRIRIVQFLPVANLQEEPKQSREQLTE
jgi:hypothetical protein